MSGAETRNTSGQPVGSGASGVDQDQFEQLPPCQFTVAGVTYAFTTESIKADGENRIIERERPYRDGAKLDDTGSKARRWTIESLFQSTSREADISAINGGLPLYPDVLNELLFLFFTHETGDLMVPTDGKVRARAQTYSRTEKSGERDCALVQLVFVEDNEDSVDFRSLQAPSANANARRLASTTTFDVQSAGAWLPSLNDLDQLVGSLEDQVNAPGEVAGDVQQSATRIQGNAVRAGQAFKNGARSGRDMFLDPTNSRAERKLVRQRDMSARAANEARRGRPQLATVIFQEETTLFRVASIVNQSFDELLEVNPELDPYFIPALTHVHVFATQDLLNGSRNAAA
jgi:hypothetical protein